jgi:hypothetical protein
VLCSLHQNHCHHHEFYHCNIYAFIIVIAVIIIIIIIIIIIASTVFLYLLFDRVVRAYVGLLVTGKEVLCDDVRTHFSVRGGLRFIWCLECAAQVVVNVIIFKRRKTN